MNGHLDSIDWCLEVRFLPSNVNSCRLQSNNAFL